MSNKQPNDNAFPNALDMSGNPTRISGLTKREYFACNAPILELCGMYYDRSCCSTEQAAQLAVSYADALINELNKVKVAK